jgi:hypothetical protein
MPSTMNRSQALLGVAIGVTLVMGVGAGVVPRLAHPAHQPAAQLAGAGPGAGTGTNASAPPAASASPDAPPSPDVVAVTAPAPATSAPAPLPTVTPSTSAPSSPDPAASDGVAVAAAVPPGQRLEPTSAQVQAAASALHQRIPLFAPTASQLRTFADAVCTSFDQGQSQAQVQATVQQAVSRIQGASLSAADADFAVRTVVALRCPGYLP